MSTDEKLISKIENYRSGAPISFSELKKYLLLNGFTCNEKTGSSHMKFKHDLYPNSLAIPVHSNYVKRVYVKLAVGAVEYIRMEKER